MKNFSKSAAAIVAVAASALLPMDAHAGGYEKPVSFSGRWAGVGGAAVSSVSGAESLYFNPAGLAGGIDRAQVTGDFSPTLLHFSGPLEGQSSVDSNRSFIPAFGAFASYKINDRWGVGFGTYLAGGAKAIYENVDYTQAPTLFGQPANPNLLGNRSTIQSNLSIIEFSLGTGYEVLDGLRIGIAYRVAMVHAVLGAAIYDKSNFTLETLAVDGISGTAWNGFRLGLQYAPKESGWGVGFDWRTAVAFTGKGTLSGNVTLGVANPPTPAGTQIPITSNDATVSSTFPQAFDLGGHYALIPRVLRMHLQYTFTHYSVDQQLALAGVAATSLGSASLPGIDQSWVNEHDARLGFEYFDLVPGVVLRASYVLSSQVTPSNRARPTFTPPGLGHTLALGAGTSLLANALDHDGAIEYGWSSATVAAGTASPTDMTSGLPGDYSANAWAAHLGMTYHL
jgi:long-subunit fatty acid transport protein